MPKGTPAIIESLLKQLILAENRATGDPEARQAVHNARLSLTSAKQRLFKGQCTEAQALKVVRDARVIAKSYRML